MNGEIGMVLVMTMGMEGGTSFLYSCSLLIFFFSSSIDSVVVIHLLPILLLLDVFTRFRWESF